MSRSYWTIEYQTSAGGWTADGNIPRPNADFVREYVSTQQVIQLADGSKAYVTPETYYGKSQISFVWYDDDGTYKTKIQNYIINHEIVRITTHLSETITGRFINLKSTHLLGISPDAYDLEALFEVQS